MNFVRSRLALVSLLVAWPCAQLAGCSVKEREYGPASEGGAGGTESNGGMSAKGGSSGKGSGGSTGSGATGGTEGGMAGDMSNATGGTDNGVGGSTGGSSTGGSSTGAGGKGGSRGGTGGSSAGGTTGGTGTSGGAGEAGASGEAGMSGAGNPTGGTGGTSTVCVPTGSTENCTDGIDNDCDGVTDCLTLTSEFPSKTGAASASDVAYTFAAHASTGSFECRVTHGTSPSGNFSTCAKVSGNSVTPFTTTFAQDATKDGLWTTEVRLGFPDGGHSATYRRTVYVHHTLYNVTRCTPPATDQAFADFAKAHLEDAGAIDETNARSPFVQVKFTPPIDARYYVSSTDGLTNIKSLRRNFGFSSDGHFLVLTRTYTAKAGASGMGCLAAVKRVHQKRGQWDSPTVVGADDYQSCTALVFNKKGAGFCLGYQANAIVSAEHKRGDNGAQIPVALYLSQEADNFAWRHLTASVMKTSFFNFSPKCDTSSTCTSADTSGYTIYLPDKSFFPYFTD
jgi:hypothetical protein